MFILHFSVNFVLSILQGLTNDGFKTWMKNEQLRLFSHSTEEYSERKAKCITEHFSLSWHSLTEGPKRLQEVPLHSTAMTTGGGIFWKLPLTSYCLDRLLWVCARSVMPQDSFWTFIRLKKKSFFFLLSFFLSTNPWKRSKPTWTDPPHKYYVCSRIDVIPQCHTPTLLCKKNLKHVSEHHCCTEWHVTWSEMCIYLQLEIVPSKYFLLSEPCLIKTTADSSSLYETLEIHVFTRNIQCHRPGLLRLTKTKALTKLT